MSAPTCFIDFDKTVVEQWSSTPIPGVAAHLAALRQAGWRTVLVTNQGGPAWRALVGGHKHPSVEEVVERLVSGLAALQWLPDLVLVATHARDDHPQEHAQLASREIAAQLSARLETHCEASADPTWRKPGVGMLERARELGFAGPYLLIGDYDPHDGAAARAFGARFVFAERWHKLELSALSS